MHWDSNLNAYNPNSSTTCTFGIFIFLKQWRSHRSYEGRATPNARVAEHRMAAASPLRRKKVFMLIYSTKLHLSANTKPIDFHGEEVEHANASINSSLTSLCKQNRLKDALHILQGMFNPQSSAYISLLQACIHSKRVPQGKLVHAHIIQTRFQSHGNNLLDNRLVTLYSKCGYLVDARKVFDEMPERDVVSWTAMIAAYSKQGLTEEALRLFYQMRLAGAQLNEFTFSSVLPVCARMSALEHGKEIHKEIIGSGVQSNVFVGCALVDMYVKCGCMEHARKVFDEMANQNVVSWTAMIVGYAQNGSIDEALRLFRQMPNRDVVSWSAMIAAFSQHGLHEEALRLFCEMQMTGVLSNQFTFASALPACTNLGNLGHGKEIHGGIIRRGFHADPFLQCALVDMYVKCGSMDCGQMVFDEITERSVVSWNAMIAGYAQSGDVDKAMELFQEMPERDVISWNAIVAGYAQNGLIDEALKLFRIMPERNVVSWTLMIAACAQSGQSDESLNLFQQMRMIGMNPDSDTFASVFTACSNLSALEHGKKIHGDIIRRGFLFDVFAGSALLDMYAKCGSIQDAQKHFEIMPKRNVVSWSVMIVGYAMHGCAREALQFFEQMQCSGMNPDHVTFIGVLSACCHAGLVDDGWRYFNLMTQYYHITPRMEHYCCMVDLLGRAGLLNEAHDFINKMPIKPDAAVWGSMLGACRIHTNVELGEMVAEHLIEFDPKNAVPYVLLSNIYAADGRWDGIQKVRKMMKDMGIRKEPGRSWIEVDNHVHTFFVGDRSHPQTELIYAKLEKLSGQMKEAGYVPDMNFVLHDVEEEQKEHALYHHSEKLAIAFGLLNTSPGTRIRIVKNFRVCGDCHTGIKFISKIVAREIVVRDANRFHHFKDGQCSCGDFW